MDLSKNKLDLDVKITEKLYESYQSILWTHRVKMSQPVIRLVDSKNHWGQWHAELRCIDISRNLVMNHSWFHVESILAHEMAHQYVAEIDKNLTEVHGELFLRACKKLGVPFFFQKAAVDMQTHNLNDRESHENEISEKFLIRIQKLLNLATSSNEHEALLAMSKAREIQARYQLENKNLHGRDESSIFHVTLCPKKKRLPVHYGKICGILAGHFFVQIIYGHEFDVNKAESFQVMHVMGHRAHVLMAEYVYYFLLQELEFLVKKLKEKKGGQLSLLEAKSYRLGVLQGFQDQLQRQDQDQVQKYKSSTDENEGQFPLGYALVLQKDKNQSALLDRYIEMAFPRVHLKGIRRSSILRETYQKGHHEGQQMTLRRGLEEHQNSGRRLLLK